MRVELGRYQYSQTIHINLNVLTPKAFPKKVRHTKSKTSTFLKTKCCKLKGLISMQFLNDLEFKLKWHSNQHITNITAHDSHSWMHPLELGRTRVFYHVSPSLSLSLSIRRGQGPTFWLQVRQSRRSHKTVETAENREQRVGYQQNES